jgi:putative FmdB family regulatory protein
MPIYEYRCNECGQIFEEWQKDFAERDMDCSMCGGKAKRVISNTSFVLKGSGWYVTDYCRGNGNGGSKNGGEAKPESGAGSKTSGSGASGDAAGAGDSAKPDAASSSAGS